MYQKERNFLIDSPLPDFAIKLFSISTLNEMGVSNDAQHITGASKIEKQFSATYITVLNTFANPLL